MTSAGVANVLDKLVAVPRGPGVCPNCHTWKVPTERWCENCEEVAAVLLADPLPISLVTLYAKPSDLRDWLTRYKGREGEEDPWDAQAEAQVKLLFRRFFERYRSRLGALQRADVLTVVPSTDRPPPHPLELLLASIDIGKPIERVLHRTAEPIGFRQPNADAYRPDVTGPRRVYLVDDVYTTGAHLNSAAEALRLGGAEVTGALVLARRINPDYNEAAHRLWDCARSVPYSWETGPLVMEK